MSTAGNVGVLAVGILLLGVNLLVLGPMATGAVPGAVDDAFATYPKDNACANDDCSEVNEDWASSVSTRDYYAWNLSNPDDVLYGDDPQFVKIGPVTYEIITNRTLLDYDADAGTMEIYSSSDSDLDNITGLRGFPVFGQCAFPTRAKSKRK